MKKMIMMKMTGMKLGAGLALARVARSARLGDVGLRLVRRKLTSA